ncbi:MAG TPA: transglycosylase domain-containing protein [Kofleriaceae bacterium]|jgi:hypothetical protein
MQSPTGTRSLRRRRWPWVAGGIAATLTAAVLVGVFAVYPWLGAKMVRAKIGDKLGTKLGRQIAMGGVEVTFGHAVIHDLEIRGPKDGATPLIHVKRIDVEFDTKASFVGTARLGAARLDGVDVAVHRDADGGDNVRDMIDKLREGRSNTGAGGGESSLRPTQVVIEHIHFKGDDAVTGANAYVGTGHATWKPGELVATLESLSATTTGAPKAKAAELKITKRDHEPPLINVKGGELEVFPKLALSGIDGSISANPKVVGEYTIDLAGSYGGVADKLWTAKGAVSPGERTGTLDLVAAKFQLDRLAPLLEDSPVVDYAGTSVDTSLHLSLAGTLVTFAGDLSLRGLNVGHPMIADQEVHDLDLSGKSEGTLDLASRTLTLTKGDFTSRGVPFAITGKARQLTKKQAAAIAELPPVLDQAGNPIKRLGPANLEEVEVHLVIPPLDCQKMLTAIPPEMVPYMQGYKMKGVFDTDIDVAIDWRDLDATRLDGHVGIKHCKVVDEPDDGPKRLLKEFEHYVEVDEGNWLSFVVGPSNDDFVPFADISPHLINSIMTTEDGGFYKHHGFITSEFKSALIANLKVGAFRRGASSITMQFVKNVLLYREKTIFRKLQELFLTWHVENTLDKDRILEIYFNVIEYGPGIYGIGPASWHYFSHSAKDLTPREAAFFSTILPNPKERYKQYCQNTLRKSTDAKIDRILALMLKKERLTEDQYKEAMATPLLFAKDDKESEKDCLERVKKAIKNARSTNPLAPPKQTEPDSKKSKSSKKHDSKSDDETKRTKTK